MPYELPANATQSGTKSRSSKGGTPANFNEIRMEDKKGAEQLWARAAEIRVGKINLSPFFAKDLFSLL